MKLLLPLLTSLAPALAANISTVYQFPNGTWLENIAPMRNGSFLVTMIGRAEVHIVTPSTHSSFNGNGNTNATSSLAASFPAHNAILGITEMQPDVFAVAVGNVTASNSPVEGTFGVYRIAFTSPAKSRAHGKTTAAVVDKIADLPTQGLINGITFLPPSTLYLADSWAGNIVALNASSGQSIGTLEHPTFRANFSAPGLVIGVNGVRVHDDYLYFSNTVQNILGRIPLDDIVRCSESEADEKVKVEVEIIKQGEEIAQPDDFVVLRDGSVLLARPLADTLQHVGLDRNVEEVARGGDVSGGTSVVRGEKGEFYVSTSGLVGGVSREGGRVVRVEL